jgi:imidazolonepropionase-like amidohydrolase
MARGIHLLATLAALAAWSGSPRCRAEDSIVSASHPNLVIEHVSVVDVVNGRVAGPNTVLISNGRIAAISEPGTTAVTAAAVRVDGQGKYLIPGLVDMHVHLFNNASHRPPNDWAFPLFIANGVTAVREMSTEIEEIPIVARWRTTAAEGQLIAPDILAAGVPVREDSTESVRREVREAPTVGADFIKIFSGVRESQWRAVLDEARKHRTPVCGHIPAETSVLTAARAGQRTNEHLTQIYEACSPKEKQFLATRRGLSGKEIIALRDGQEREVLASFDQRLCDRTAAALARTGQVQVPTLVLPHFEARGARAQFRDDPRWRYLRADEQTRWEKNISAETTPDRTLASLRWEVSRKIVNALDKAGVRILAGTDTPMPLVYPGFSLHKELELLVESGLSPAEALRAATIAPAEFLGLGGTSGSIAVGRRADLVLLEDDPLRDISNTQRIHAVVLNGRLLQRADLDALLAPEVR